MASVILMMTMVLAFVPILSVALMVVAILTMMMHVV